MALLQVFKKNTAIDIAIDLGTRNLLICNQLRVLVNESSNIARPQKKGKRHPVIYGNAAFELARGSSPEYTIERPVKRGVISDIDACSDFLEKSIRPHQRKPRVLITHPLGISSLEKKAFRTVAENAGASKVILIPEPVAFAAGICPHFTRENAILMIDVGAGITEVVLFFQGKIVSSSAIRVGGEDLEEELISYLKRRRNFLISQSTALSMLHHIAYLRNESFLKPISVYGKDLESGLPTSITLEAQEVEASLNPLFLKIIGCAMEVLDNYPPEMSESILTEGIYFTGGASRFPRIKELLKEKTHIPMPDDQQPLLGVARGEIQILHDTKLLEFLTAHYDT